MIAGISYVSMLHYNVSLYIVIEQKTKECEF